MSLKALIEKMDELNSSAVSEATKATATGRIHKAEPGGYGRKDDEDSEGKKVEPAVKRGRGRPKKNADSDTGQVAKYDNAKNLQSFMVGNLPGGKAPGKKGQVHKIKDESIEESTDVTDFTPKSQGGTRKELIAKYKKTKDPKDAEAARKAGATQKELQDADKNVSEATKETSTGKIHKAEPGGYGRKDDEDDEGKKVQPQVKRGRGRPKKNADSDTGEVKKWDTDKLSSWIIGNKPKTLPGKASVKHKLKDWMEHVEREMIVESITQEGRMGDVDALMQDLAAGDADIYDVMNSPSTPEEKYASRILQGMYDDIVIDRGLHPDDDFEEIIDAIGNRLAQEYGRELDEMTLDQSQVAAPQVKAPGAPTTSTTTKPTQTSASTQQPSTGSTQPGMGMAVIDFKNPNDPLKSAVQQAVNNKQVAVMATESKQINESTRERAEKLEKILRNYPMEHRMAQEGWGMHESLYQALCDHYWDEGRIPREKMYGEGQGLRDWVEECYMEDMQPVMENPVIAAAARGMAAGVGATAANKLLDSDYSMEEEMGNDLGVMEQNMSESKLNEKAKSKAQQKFMGMVHAAQKGEKPASKAVGDVAKSMKKGDVKDFAKTKHKGLPEKVKKKTDESVEQGVAEGFMDTVKGMFGGSKPAPGRLTTYTPSEYEFHVPFMNVDGKPRAGTGPGYSEGAIWDKFNKLARIVEPQGGKMYIYPRPETNQHGNLIIKVKSNLDAKTIKNELAKNNLFPADFAKAILVDPQKNMDYASRAGQQFEQQGVTEEQDVEESGLQAYLGNKKYGKEGMDALRKAGREGAGKEKMAKLRAKFDKHDAQMESWNKQLSTLLNEGLTITTSTGNEHTPDSVSVNATDADAHQLMQLIQHAGLGKKQSASMSAPAADSSTVAVEPVSQDEVMGTLEPEDDGEETFGFLKRMLGARGEHSSSGDYAQEGGDTCGDCGKSECECDHGEVDESDNYEATQHAQGDSQMSPIPEDEMEEGNMFTGNLAKARAAGKKEADLDGDGDMEPVKETDMEDLKRLAGTVPKREEPVKEEDMEEGNKFTGNLAKARAAGKKEADLDGDGDMEPVKEDDWKDAGSQDLAASVAQDANDKEDAETEKETAMSEGEETCNECGMYESKCDCDHGEEQLDELSPQTLRSYADKARNQAERAAGIVKYGGQYDDYRSQEKPQYRDRLVTDPDVDYGPEDSRAKFSQKRYAGAARADAKLNDKRVKEASMEEEKLDEWANSPNGSSKDESFLTDLQFITKSISGGLNNMKQDQTVLPSTRVKTDTERMDSASSMAEMIRKLSNIN